MDITDERDDPCAIGNHIEGTPLGHSLLAVKEAAGPIHVAYHQGGPVAITVEYELPATGPLELNGPQHCRSIIPIERVLHINEE